MRVSVLDLLTERQIVGKKRGNQTYYYLVESARVDGKPRIVEQQYLGSTAEVMARLAGAPAGSPERTQHRTFGDLAAVWAILERLNVAERSTRRADPGAPMPVRRSGPTWHWPPPTGSSRRCSKLAFANWWATAGPLVTKVPVAATDHRRFWDAMDALDVDKLAAAERAIAAAMVTEFGLDLSGLALDRTNFATFIDSTNDRAPNARRGHAKQKRNDLRLVGLALVVTRDGAIPVTSHVYPGNRPDVTQFTDVLDELTSRYATLFTPATATMLGTGVPDRRPRWCSTPARTAPRTSPTFKRAGCTSSARCHRATSPTGSPSRPAGAARSTPTGLPDQCRRGY